MYCGIWDLDYVLSWLDIHTWWVGFIKSWWWGSISALFNEWKMTEVELLLAQPDIARAIFEHTAARPGWTSLQVLLQLQTFSVAEIMVAMPLEVLDVVVVKSDSILYWKGDWTLSQAASSMTISLLSQSNISLYNFIWCIFCPNTCWRNHLHTYSKSIPRPYFTS